MVAIVMSTWDDGSRIRYDYARSCISALNQYLVADEPVDLVLADDGSPEPNMLVDAVSKWAHGEWKITSGAHGGIGTSLNRAIPAGEPWLYTTDDWLLTGPLDIRQAMQLTHLYDLVRIGPVHPNLLCRTRFQQNIGWWLELDSTEGGFVFATRPFVAAPSMRMLVGDFDEGLNSYEVERLYALRFAAAGARAAAVTLHGPWRHIGDYEVGYRDITA
jgi:hypothetical protein